eukprot:1157855-Pelagomonas_calceolata.AAC.5
MHVCMLAGQLHDFTASLSSDALNRQLCETSGRDCCKRAGLQEPNAPAKRSWKDGKKSKNRKRRKGFARQVRLRALRFTY